MKHKKTIIICIILLAIGLVVSALVNSTYALFSNDSYGANTNVYSTGMLSIEATSKTNNILLENALPMTDEDGLKTNPYVFTIKNIGNLDYLFDVKLLSTGDSSITFLPQYIKLQIDDGSVTTLSSLSSNEIKSDITLSAGESIDISIRVWLSIDTPNTELGKSFNSRIVTDGKAVYTSSNNEYNVNAVQYINDLYNNAEKTPVVNNDITYNYASSVSLMNDRLGGTSNGYDSGNIRYYGANPDNYIYFNCSDYHNQSDSTCEKWRIIGIVDGKVKIIRSESIGGYSYNSTVPVSNDWSNSSLKDMLNNGTYYTESISKNADTLSLISNSTWYINGMPDSNIYSNTSYIDERTGSSTWTGNIALAYPSDYGYAADFNRCSNTLSNYTSEECKNSNWLEANDYKWFITPSSYYNSHAWFAANGHVYGYYEYDGYDSLNVQYPFNVYPTIYLEPEVIIAKGDGTSGNPYHIYIGPELVEPAPLSDFEYYLGSEHPTVTKIKYYSGNIGAPGDVSDAEISLAENEILLTRYIGNSKAVFIPDTYEVNGVTYNVTVLSYAMSGDGYSYTMYWTGIFYENQNIKSVNFGEDIKFIYHYYSYEPVDVDDSGNYIFGYNIMVEENDMNSLFSGCTSLVNVPTIPSTVTNMNNAFWGCTNLTGTVRINSSNVTGVSNIFYNTSKAITVEVPAGSTSYTKFSAASLPSNVTLNTFTAS